MIKSIKLKNCATYPSEGVSIENCQKINFFYGPNGSGKSTISNFLRNPTDSQRSGKKNPNTKPHLEILYGNEY